MKSDSIPPYMHKEAYPTFLNFETELSNLEMGQNPRQSEIKKCDGDDTTGY